MKKVFVMTIMMLSLASSGFAATFGQESSDGTILCGATAGSQLSIGLSPNVNAGYTVSDNTGTDDFFVISTYHTQGDEVFATAQTLTKIYTAGATTDVTMATLFASVPQDAATAASDDQWSSGLGWSAQ